MRHSVKECLIKYAVITARWKTVALSHETVYEAAPSDDTNYQLTLQVLPVNCELLSVYCMISMRTPLGSVTQACQD